MPETRSGRGVPNRRAAQIIPTLSGVTRSAELMISRSSAGRALALKNRTSRTRSEQQCADLLTMMQLQYREQVPIGGFIVDFVLAGHSAVVEVYGGYWHNLPKHISRDKRRRQFLRRAGYRLIVLRQSKTHLWMKQLLDAFGLCYGKTVRKQTCGTSR